MLDLLVDDIPNFGHVFLLATQGVTLGTWKYIYGMNSFEEERNLAANKLFITPCNFSCSKHFWTVKIECRKPHSRLLRE